MKGRTQPKANRKYIFFYLTLIYIVAFLIWWTFLLYNKTETLYEHRISTEIWKTSSFQDSHEHVNLLSKFQREKIMIVAEGSVFFLILLVLIFRAKKAVEQEIYFSKQQQNFILSITHELKSPLSSIKLMSQTLAKHNLKDDQKDKLVKNTLNEVERLQNLVENVLLAAKIDNDAYGFSKSEVNFSELLENLLINFKEAQGVPILFKIDKEILIQADISGLTSIIINLIENANKYSPAGANIEVSLTKNEHQILFTVSDVGIGISDEEKLSIFDKFYRIGCEETRSTKGTGLGLYIVKQLVAFHNGNILVKDNKPKGSIFVVTFQV